MSVASKNLFDLLGNDEGDDTPAAPVKTVDKTSTHTVKRNTDGAAPAAKTAGPATGSRRGGAFSGSEAAFRDRQAGSDRNRGKSTDEGPRGGARGGRGARGRGGRGGGFSRDRDDRHTKGPAGGSDKQAAQSWGAVEGDAELKDEQAGEEIAKTEQKDAAAEGDADETLAEPEEKQVSYTEYLAQLAEKKLALSGDLAPRKANEGSKSDKKWADAKPLVKEEDDDFISGSGGKAKRERERKTKQFVEIENRFIESDRPRGGRGGRGGAAGRGGERGERGERGDRRGGDRGGRGRGGERGDRGGSRGEFRGARGGRDNTAINTKDTSAFPSLGA